jgi:hypothetical protein
MYTLLTKSQSQFRCTLTDVRFKTHKSLILGNSSASALKSGRLFRYMFRSCMFSPRSIATYCSRARFVADPGTIEVVMLECGGSIT